jgi:NADH dehydrogenase/NADH:ubiquinone oxidoreductase subunit G
MISITVNSSPLAVEEGDNLLKALQGAGVRLPAICFHPALHKTVGVCRLCTVEVATPGKPPELIDFGV